ncbi:hypothetical protein BC835DRAFT_1414920 [Cytidiella melzeri]|nr:hypothetical protein BC835DRAFT_1414920 [Cytidiella melzeri]
MAKAERSLIRRTRAQSQLVSCPRRIDDSDRREKIRRAKYPSGAIDCWLCAKSPDTVDPDTRLAEEEVLCTVHLEYTPNPDTDPNFDNGGVYTLYLGVATSGDATTPPPCRTNNPGVSQMHPRIVLGKYEGWKEFIEAPDWTKRKPGRELVFRESRTDLAVVLSRVASEEVNDKLLIRRLESIQLK